MAISLKRRVKDRDYVETSTGLIFCVLGYLHPPDRIVSYLKYVMTEERTMWSREGVHFKRVIPYYSAQGYEHVLNLLKSSISRYVVYDPVFNVELIEVPRSEVVRHYLPEERAQEILSDPRDELEALAKELIEALVDHSGINRSSIGITGSLLIRIHNVKLSDIDLVVYGRENYLSVMSAIRELVETDGRISLPDVDTLASWATSLCRIHSITFSDACRIYRERLSRLMFRGKVFSVHAVRSDSEIREEYGDKVFYHHGDALIRAEIDSAEESIYLPAVYKIKNVEIIDGVRAHPLRELVSFEGLYSGLFAEGEIVYAYGKVERVRDVRSGEEYYRLVIGSREAKGRDFIRSKRWIFS